MQNIMRKNRYIIIVEPEPFSILHNGKTVGQFIYAAEVH